MGQNRGEVERKKRTLRLTLRQICVSSHYKIRNEGPF